MKTEEIESAVSAGISGFGRRLGAACRARGMSQCELSALTGIAPSTVSMYVHGSRTPRVGNVMSLSVALGVSADWLLFGARP